MISYLLSKGYTV